MIKIGQPYLEEKDGLYWICCIINENSQVKKVMWGGGTEKLCKIPFNRKG